MSKNNNNIINYLKGFYRKSFMIVLSITVLFCVCIPTARVKVQAEEHYISGEIYEFDKDDEYLIDETSVSKPINSVTPSYGKLSLTGNISEFEILNNTETYYVDGDSVSFKYEYDDKLLNAPEKEWHLDKDDNNAIDQINLGSKIGKGAIILQSSVDKNKWITELVLTDEFNKNPIQDKPFYTTKKLELKSRRYYRVMIAYKTAILTNQILLYKEREYKKFMELYEFCLAPINEEETKRYEFKEFYKVKTPSKYEGREQLNSKDVHSGWELGKFVINGHTDTSLEKEDDQVVFLKNADDKVELSFQLNQNINRLNDRPELSINYDAKAEDVEFGTPVMEFGRGALFVKYIDSSKEDTSIDYKTYVNYLESVSTLNADTNIRLCEEGDYIIALDYEIKESKLVPQTSNYRIAARFKVRNSNCMVYAFDIDTGNQLMNGSIVENGFYLDLNKSKYLQINVQKEILNQVGDAFVKDPRSSRIAKDKEPFTDEGIYTITATNKYTKDSTEIVIYVGSDDIVKAYITSGLSLKEIKELIQSGATVDKNGNIILPEKSIDNNQQSIVETPLETQEPHNPVEQNTKELFNKWIVYGLLCACLIIAIAVIMNSKKKNRSKGMEE